jgi:hypothetical protein
MLLIVVVDLGVDGWMSGWVVVCFCGAVGIWGGVEYDVDYKVLW